ncbi:MAG: hypothetical protein Q9168_006925 [Polycauliona sp. 1 TL-2023]
MLPPARADPRKEKPDDAGDEITSLGWFGNEVYAKDEFRMGGEPENQIKHGDRRYTSLIFTWSSKMDIAKLPSTVIHDLEAANPLKSILGGPKAPVAGAPTFFTDKTVLLTGGTGHLGGCLLYKLTAILRVQRIYVLCRSSAALAKITISKNMPMQAKEVLAHPGLVFVQGDIQQPDFAIAKPDLERMEKEVQVVINAAADISLAASLQTAIASDCMPPLELARMATKFQHLEHFIQISTAYCNSFLPDGVVEEKMYPLGDAEKELSTARETGSSEYLVQFPAPYYYAKHLMERLLTSRYPDLPVLLLRPTTIAEAIQQPCRLYGVDGSCPLTTFYQIYIAEPGNATWYIPPETGRTTGSNVIDVIPVDWVANLVLLHATTRTKGVVHAGAESYRVGDTGLDSTGQTHDPNVEECPGAQFFKVGTRDWRFSNKASVQFRSVEGPLHISVDDHEPGDLILEMLVRVATDIIQRKTKEGVRALI